MKSILFCTSYIRNEQQWQQRYQRWLNYYQDGPIEAVRKIMIDDGSPWLPTPDIIKTVPSTASLSLFNDDKVIVRFADNLGRQSVSAYPGWWRSFLHGVTLARELGVDKIVHIESDAYILSQHLADFINGIESGWHVLWCQRYRFPETAIQVICGDQFELFEQFKACQPDLNDGDLAENLLPFTAVHRQFKGERYSEVQKNRGFLRSKKFDFIPFLQRPFFRESIPDDADFVTQAVISQQFAFRKNS
ncbi:hypothetical protein [Janthinobacterium sp. PC23-8]|uniref:hypothetical protein n=1 Tax=Janthinobacterium sp. PC23-8 TaxID=2012679 RepID=UPI000B9756AF|nr:hypothetical protein [Janthinobacterium sp. PC23-8]OYO25762.1 hypothetical protein CD932_27095 [Janthinobacterium sp. PC23-8]